MSHISDYELYECRCGAGIVLSLAQVPCFNHPSHLIIISSLNIVNEIWQLGAAADRCVHYINALFLDTWHLSWFLKINENQLW